MNCRRPGPLCELLEAFQLDVGTLPVVHAYKPGPLNSSAASTTTPTKRNVQEAAEIKRVAGIIYGESNGIFPALKPGTEASMANWDDASVKQLHAARVLMAKVAYGGKRLVSDSVIPDEKKLPPPTKALWKDCLAAADEVYGSTSIDHFIIWPSSDGKTPDADPKLPAAWPYNEKTKIKRVFGPFRVPTQLGDVPKGSNIYVFDYVGVK